MERSEPALVPEWLRSSGSVSGGGSSAPHFVSSSHSDESSSAHHTRNRNSKSTSDFDSPRSVFIDRTSSSNSRRSSSNGSAKHAYSSFSRSQRDKDRERDKDRLNFGDHWDHDVYEPFGTLLSRSEKDSLRRSHSMVSRKPVEVLPRRSAAVDLKNGSSSNHANGNGLISGVSAGVSIQKVVFEKDFPSLGSEERQGVPDIGRVSSPGLTTAVQSLPVGSSAIGGEGWTSALAEVPPIIGINSTGSVSASQSLPIPASGAANAMHGLNMAEALTQAPSKTRAAPQLSVQTQRLEELAIKQSRQLIPVTPSMPKSSVLSSSDKLKSKTVVRSGEMTIMAAKTMQQQPSSLHLTKPDSTKSSHGKLMVLKPARENGAAPSPKDIATPNNASRAPNTLLVPPSAPSAAPLRSPNNAKLSSGERKTNMNLISGLNVEKKPSPSQTQSRLDFFKLLKKKTSANTSTTLPDSPTAVSSPTSEKSSEVNKDTGSDPSSRQAVQNGNEVSSNGEDFQRFSDEEQAFLRSLGWEEKSGEDDFLTEEEINSFFLECMKLKPTLQVCQGMQQKLLATTGFVGASSSELISSDPEPEI